MDDITDIIERFRQASRTLWNAFFWAHEDYRTSYSYGQFLAIHRQLFRSLVCDLLDGPAVDILDEMAMLQAGYRVTLRPGTISVLLASRETPGGCRWSPHSLDVNPAEPWDIVFLDLFDLAGVGPLEWSYYRGLIRSAGHNNPQFVDHLILIPVQAAGIGHTPLSIPTTAT